MYWQMFSCLCTYILVKTKIDIKTFALLCKLLKSLTMKHIKKKAAIFTRDEFLRAVKDMYNDENPKDLVNKLAVCLAYYGLLRLEEVLKVTRKDVQLDLTEDIEVDFPYSTKHSLKDCSFKLPGWLKPLFERYLLQFPVEQPKTNRFLKNYTKCKSGKG